MERWTKTPCPVGTDLAGGVEIAQQRAGHGVLDIGILEDEDGRFAAEFQRHLLERLGRRRHDPLARADRAGERDLADRRMRRQQTEPVRPSPGSTLKTPSGTPASVMIAPRRSAVSGVSSDGLKIIALPQASAGAAFQQAIWSG